MARPRDSQCSKVWASLDQVNGSPLNLKTLQVTADKIVKSAWFKRRARRVNEKYSVLHGATSHCSEHNWAQLGLTEQTLLGLLHQLAHYMTPTDVAWHGPEFAKTLLDLVGHIGLGLNTPSDQRKLDREKLKKAFNAHGVKWRVYSEEAREGARSRWIARDLKNLAAELQGKEAQA